MNGSVWGKSLSKRKELKFSYVTVKCTLQQYLMYEEVRWHKSR